MSTHRVEVVRVPALEPHPNADSLSLIHLWGYSVVIRTEDWTAGDLAAYIPPDYVVPERPEYEYLRDTDGRFHGRIRVKRFRGLLSQGLLVPAPAGAKEGDDVREALGIERYVPPADAESGQGDEPEVRWAPIYDIEDGRRYPRLFRPGEPVVVTEKLHGQNVRFTWADGRLRVGSRSRWKDPTTETLIWPVVRANPWIERLCYDYPEDVFYGELFGWVQDLRYGATGPQDRWIRLFDVLRGNVWQDWGVFTALVPREHYVPVLYEGPFQEGAIGALIDGASWLTRKVKHHREGIVVRPLTERTDPEVGRVQLKLVSNLYLERA